MRDTKVCLPCMQSHLHDHIVRCFHTVSGGCEVTSNWVRPDLVLRSLGTLPEQLREHRYHNTLYLQKPFKRRNPEL